MKENDDNNLFYMIPKKEIEKLIRIEDKLDQVLSFLGSQERVNKKFDEYLTEKEAQESLGIKYGALYKLRISGKLG